MRRTDRLFELVQILRDGRMHRATDMAAALKVSTRTIWRDMDRLAASGLPVGGARGLGYRVTAPVTLPPLNLSQAELDALHLGLALVGQAPDAEMQAAARALAAKVDAVLPEGREAPPGGWGIADLPFADLAPGMALMPAVRVGIRQHRKLSLRYTALDGTQSDTVLRPLQMDTWGRVWTVTGWCETAADFRVFRLDRIDRLDLLDEPFTDDDGTRLDDYLARFSEGPDGN